MKDIIKRLVEISSPSGREESVQNLIKGYIQSYVDEVYTDSLGNLIARQKRGWKKASF